MRRTQDLFPQPKLSLLTDILDRIVNRRISSLARLSNTWLCFQRSHPLQLQKYHILFSDTYCFDISLTFFKHISSLLLLLFQSTLKLSSYGRLKVPLYDCILVSHLVKTISLQSADDFYYSITQQSLSSSGLSSLMLYMNHIPRSVSLPPIDSSSSKSVLPHIPPIAFLISSIIQGFIDFMRLLYEASSTQDQFDRNVTIAAAVHSLSSDSVTTIARSLLISELVRLSKARNLILLYEGHAWERSVIFASRSSNSKLNVYAYQHAILFPHQHSILRPLSPQCEPNCVFTSGLCSHQILSKVYSSYPQSPKVRLVGSPRHLKAPPSSNQSRSNVILLLPEGTMAESLHFINLALESARLLPTHTFLIRFHPLIHSHILLSVLGTSPESLPPNITISQSTLHYDVSLSSFAIYHGSSSISLAALSRLFCLRYDYIGDSSIGDPFFLTGFKPTSFSSASSLRDIVLTHRLTSNTLRDQAAAANSLYSPFQPQSILFALSSSPSS